MIYAYIRVSTDKQTIENQRHEIQRYCKHTGICIDKWIEETASGTTSYSSRMLGKVIKRMNKDDVLVCSELSRLGRTLFMIMEILSLCLNKGCRVYTVKDNFCLGDNIESKVLAFAFGLSAEIERTLISQRTREALQRLRNEGKPLGRPKGAKGRHNKMQGKAELARQLHREYGVKEACKILGVSKSTFYRCCGFRQMIAKCKQNEGADISSLTNCHK